MKNIAVILAGGKGTRLGDSTPKQFLLLGGAPVIEYSLQAFQSHPDISEICVVCNSDYIERIDTIIKSNRFPKLTAVIPGGSERYESSLNAIKFYEKAGDSIAIIFHDAARPFVSHRIISDMIAALRDYRACTAAIPATDTIVRTNGDGLIADTLPRNELRNVQTPQGFWLSVISDAYKIALSDSDFKATDDCGVVCRYMPHIPVKIIEGDSKNFKITHADDLGIAESILASS